ncbi:MAG: hypothetical protein LBD77_06960 [Bifidobacteriaceae bacterium]|jgi:hypothetical protein|nr:hypothetical protein [Bifidobacteriaceae bacterium]
MTADEGPWGWYRPLLAQYHSHLAERFATLQLQRRQIEAPVFALEHGLPTDEVEQVSSAVQACVRTGTVEAVSQGSWLPFVVYSVEVGYKYDGLTFWPGFETLTSGWTFSDRDLLADWFRRFHEEYGGAAPQGPWAAQFKKISWPITHAVLPVYLQRHLAHLLYDNRALSSQYVRNRVALVRHDVAQFQWMHCLEVIPLAGC